MAKKNTLNVYMNGELVAGLKKLSSGAIEFKYADHWIDNFPNFPVSRRLPVTEDVYKGAEVTNFFENLLPDSIGVREKIAAQTKSESKETFDILFSIGRDCVGALQIIPKSIPAPLVKEAKGELISDEDIVSTINNLHNQPLGLNEQNDFRISLAGQQEKTAYLKLNGKWHKPLGATPTTHIFKPAMGVYQNGLDMSSSVENEWLCLQICKLYGLDVAEAEINTFLDKKILVVKRFDRRWKGKILYRLPQEDMCQALGIPSSKKYQSDGGPGMKEIMNLLLESDQSDLDRKKFMKAQIVFWLIAAIDGHAKNFSIFWQSGGFKLTPIYDVLSASPMLDSKVLSKHKVKMAMWVGENKHYILNDIVGRHWLQMSKILKYNKEDIENILEDVKNLTPKVIIDIQNRVPTDYPQDMLDKIIEGIQSRVKLI